jgi:hypothetical protein
MEYESPRGFEDKRGFIPQTVSDLVSIGHRVCQPLNKDAFTRRPKLSVYGT